jgi:hypothetical protein
MEDKTEETQDISHCSKTLDCPNSLAQSVGQIAEILIQLRSLRIAPDLLISSIIFLKSRLQTI